MMAADAPAAGDGAFELRGRPRPAARFNRRALLLAAVGVATLIAATTMLALRPPRARDAGEARELYNVRHVAHADGLAELPATYADLPPPAITLGPPLPGELGEPILAAERELGLSEIGYPAASGPTPFRPNPELDAEREARLRAAQIAEAARESSVFFQLTNDARATADDAAPTLASVDAAGLLGNPFAFLPQAAAPGFGSPSGLDETLAHQNQMLDFLEKGPDVTIYNPHGLQDPVSPYQVMAGSIIPASLITGINSDLPGTVIAQVTQNVYDTATGEHLLIPQGARLIGAYDSVVAFGQSRALLVWQRIVFPDGSSLVIENLPATDESGYAGLEDKVDVHTWRLLQGVVLSTLLGVGTELTFDDDESDLVEAIRESAQSAGNQAGQRIVNRALAIQPTITVRPGWPLRVIVNRDLVLRPYRG
jgi:type IV secretion system protein VirB10